jgi:hypothetical protein
MSGKSNPFTRRGGMNGECMHTTGKFGCQRLINHAVALDPGLARERVRHNINPEMRLFARPMTAMAFVLVGFVGYREALRRKSLGQLLSDDIFYAHGPPLSDCAIVRSRSAVAVTV